MLVLMDKAHSLLRSKVFCCFGGIFKNVETDLVGVSERKNNVLEGESKQLSTTSVMRSHLF